MKKAIVLLAPGFEEIEAITVVDVLRRAGVEVTVAGVSDADVTGSHGITVRADRLLAEAAEGSYDLVVLPGGLPGATNLRDDPAVQALVRSHAAAGRRVAAICAGPIALAAAGVLRGKRATSYPGFGEQLGCEEYLEEPVVTDGTVTTSRGVGTALDFALALVAQLEGADVAATQAQRMLVRR